MRPIPYSTAAGALLSTIAGSDSANTFAHYYGATLDHTTDANCLIELNATGGTEIVTLKVTDEMQYAQHWLPMPLPIKDLFVTPSAGTVVLWVD